jgi:hypothetical protein
VVTIGAVLIIERLLVECKMARSDMTKESLRSFASGILQLVKTYLSFQHSEVSDGRYDNFTVERSVCTDGTGSHIRLTIKS